METVCSLIVVPVPADLTPLLTCGCQGCQGLGCTAIDTHLCRQAALPSFLDREAMQNSYFHFNSLGPYSIRHYLRLPQKPASTERANAYLSPFLRHSLFPPLMYMAISERDALVGADAGTTLTPAAETGGA